MTSIDGAGGKRGRRFAERSRSWRRGNPKAGLRGACAVSLVSSRPGGVGAPPGDTTIPRQELANVGRGALAGKDARPGMGRNRKAGPKEATPPSATSAARRREPASRLCEQSLHTGHQGKRRDGAPEGAPAPLWPVISGRSGDGPYREAGHGCARTTRTSVSLRSISPHFFRGDEKGSGAARAPLTKRARGALAQRRIDPAPMPDRFLP